MSLKSVRTSTRRSGVSSNGRRAADIRLAFSLRLRTSALPITATTTTAQGAEEGPQEARRNSSVRSAAPHAEVQQ
eukprot:COSAG04_NODE_91_length_26852_cov_8.609315_40_plen_75_part_00